MSDGMRCCRSDWPELCLFCCSQPLCYQPKKVDFGSFCFLIFQFIPPPPQITTKVALKAALIRSFLLVMVTLYIPLAWSSLQYFDCTYQEDATWTLDAGGNEAMIL